jgi:hypothetical protein
VLVELSVTLRSLCIAIECGTPVRPYLYEPNILALLPETLAAEVETIFADETGRVSADAAVKVVLLAWIHV